MWVFMLMVLALKIAQLTAWECDSTSDYTHSLNCFETVGISMSRRTLKCSIIFRTNCINQRLRIEMDSLNLRSSDRLYFYNSQSSRYSASKTCRSSSSYCSYTTTGRYLTVSFKPYGSSSFGSSFSGTVTSVNSTSSYHPHGGLSTGGSIGLGIALLIMFLCCLGLPCYMYFRNRRRYQNCPAPTVTYQAPTATAPVYISPTANIGQAPGYDNQNYNPQPYAPSYPVVTSSPSQNNMAPQGYAPPPPYPNVVQPLPANGYNSENKFGGY